MRVIGTAGHVDHGKSALVHRLTNINPDRLAEEQRRQMTIDLGFAWLHLPSEETIGIIDVPGHRDFIENMLAGVGGIDAVLLVIAADEGVMPQTREHLAILDLLGIQHGLIVLSKIDLVKDSDWLALVEDDIRDMVYGTALESAEIVPVSAHTSQGIDTLVQHLMALLDDLPPNLDYNHPRLAVDRVFTVDGFGTVVTGTLLGGTLQIGQEIEIQPTTLHGRIRGLQSYKQPVEVAQPGSRVAVNITGVEKSAIQRGHVLAPPRQLQATLLADTHFRHLPDASRPLKHNAEVKFFVGAAESTAHVRLLDDDILPPGAEGWLQLRFDRPLPLAQGDRFIIRYASPAETIGGGEVVNPHPGRRWKRHQPQVIEQLELRRQGTPAQRIAQAADHVEPVNRKWLQQQVGYSDTDLETAIEQALGENLLIELMPGAYMAAERCFRLQQQIVNLLTEFHAQEPLRQGMQREHLRNRLGIKQTTLSALLGLLDQVVQAGSIVRLIDHEVRFSPEQQASIHRLMQAMESAAYTPPSLTEAAQIVGDDVLAVLIENGDIVRVQPDVIFTRETYEQMVSTILGWIDQHGQITAAELRDQFDTSRKYAIGLLEYLDSRRITKRQGDSRVRGPNA